MVRWSALLHTLPEENLILSSKEGFTSPHSPSSKLFVPSLKKKNVYLTTILNTSATKIINLCWRKDI